jgi:hypothetical protein
MKNNGWCKSLGKNVGLDCEQTKDARNSILFPSNRSESVDQKCIFQKIILNLQSAQNFETQKGPKTPCNLSLFFAVINFL